MGGMAEKTDSTYILITDRQRLQFGMVQGDGSIKLIATFNPGVLADEAELHVALIQLGLMLKEVLEET